MRQFIEKMMEDRLSVGAYLTVLLFSLLLVWIIYAQVNQLMMLHKQSTSITEPEVVAAMAEPLSLTSVATWDLFGKPSLEPRVVKSTGPKEKLILNGVFMSSDPELASAVIASDKAAEDIYHIGDGLPGERWLREIYNDRVVVESDGEMEELLLDFEEPRKATAASLPTATPATTRSARQRQQRERQLRQRQQREILRRERQQRQQQQIQTNPNNPSFNINQAPGGSGQFLPEGYEKVLEQIKDF